jgi:hypothetical protein
VKLRTVIPARKAQEKAAAACAEGAPPKQSYLRVSVGLERGCSPGIPYVLEIWPAGHFSPVHNHGNAFGIVRILHGSIKSSPLNFMCVIPPRSDCFAWRERGCMGLQPLRPANNSICPSQGSVCHPCLLMYACPL